MNFFHFKERSFHVSLYWALGNILPTVDQGLAAKLKVLFKKAVVLLLLCCCLVAVERMSTRE